MFISDVRRETELLVCLAQKLFCSLSVAAELAIVGALSVDDEMESLNDVVLRGGEVSVTVSVDVDIGHWYGLSQCHGAQH